LNIFPSRKTVLHYFVDNCMNLKKEKSHVNNQENVNALFKTCAKGKGYEIPIIEDCFGQTPFDIALSIKDKHKLS